MVIFEVIRQLDIEKVLKTLGFVKSTESMQFVVFLTICLISMTA